MTSESKTIAVNAETIHRTPRRTNLPVQAEVPQSGFKLGDIAYILFRHKYKIVISAILGFGAAAGYFFGTKTLYVSEAKLLIRYVLETTGTGPLDPGDQIKSPDARGENVINSEIELLTSLDLAEDVAAAVGPTNILRELGGGSSLEKATFAVSRGLLINKPASKGQTLLKSDAIHLGYEHPDPLVARNVVNTLVSRYLRLHARVHGATDELSELSRQADQKRSDIEKTEAALRSLKGDLQITSVVDAEKNLTEQIGTLETQLSTSRATLAEYRALFADQTNQLAEAVSAIRTSIPTNMPSSPPLAPLPAAEVVREYQDVQNTLDTLRRKQQDLTLQFSAQSLYVRIARSQLEATRKVRDELVAKHPGLTNVVASVTNSSGIPMRPAESARNEDYNRVIALQARVKALTEQLDAARAKAHALAERAPEILTLERKLDIDAKKYAYFSSAVDKATTDVALSSTRLANISVIQQASPPFLGTAKKIKITGGIAVAGIAIGLGLAGLVEFVADSSVRRPAQVIDKLKLRLFLSIPRLPGMSKTPATSADAQRIASALTTYAEALRDRIIMHFQLRDIHHKPKLVGVTSFNQGAGVTSVATSLAATLSETGEGNVLYIDVNPNQGASMHPFHYGKLAPVHEALTEHTRDSAQIQENLYAVTIGDTHAGRVGVVPRILAGLVPQMKDSGYDYIIFDLPPVTQTSITTRVAGLLDLNIVVLESEKTNSAIAAQAATLLSESNTQMVAVLNKHRRYLPRFLDGDI